MAQESKRKYRKESFTAMVAMVASSYSDALSVTTLESTGRRSTALKRPLSVGVPSRSCPGDVSPCRRSIRFAEKEENRVHLIPLCWEFDRETLWYSPDEFESMKKAGRVLAKETRLRGSASSVEDSYRKAQTLSFFLHDEDALEGFLCDGNNDPDLLKYHAQDFCTWAQRKNTCRGLEHWTSKAHFTTRIDIKNEVRKAVMSMALLGKCDETIARASRAYSRSSRIMARFWGLADSQFKISFSKYERLCEEVMEAYRKSNQVVYPLESLYNDTSDEEDDGCSNQLDSQSDLGTRHRRPQGSARR